MENTENQQPQTPPKLPLRYWIMIDNGLMTQADAVAKWEKEVANGAVYDPIDA